MFIVEGIFGHRRGFVVPSALVVVVIVEGSIGENEMRNSVLFFSSRAYRRTGRKNERTNMRANHLRLCIQIAVDWFFTSGEAFLLFQKSHGANRRSHPGKISPPNLPFRCSTFVDRRSFRFELRIRQHRQRRTKVRRIAFLIRFCSSIVQTQTK